MAISTQIDAHVGGVNDLAFSHPNKQLCVITCGDDKTIKVTFYLRRAIMSNHIWLPFGTFEYHDSFIISSTGTVQTPGRVQKICVSDKAVIA